MSKLLGRIGLATAKSIAAIAARFASGSDLDIGVGRPSLTEPYKQSAWVRAAITKVVRPCSSVELCFTTNEQEIEDPNFNLFWSAPGLAWDGTRMSQADFIETLGSWLLLAGEFFLILDDTWIVPFPEVAVRTPLIIARPDRMRHILRDGALAGWELRDALGRRIQLDPERVIHVKMFNPYDDFRGLGPMEAAAIAAGADYAAAIFAKNVAEANGDQGVIVVAKGGIPDDAQRQQITASLKEKSALQRRGIFRPVFIGGDVSVEDPKVRAVDASFVLQRAENRREIAAAFGVPPSFFDPQASYSIGAASDRYILIEETCKPLGLKICGGLARVASAQAKANVSVELDWDDHSVIQTVRRERVDTGIKLWQTGMPMSLVSDYLGLDLPEYPGWQVGYLPFSVSPTGETPAPESDPILAEPDTAPVDPADIVQDMRRTFAARALPAPHPSTCTCQLPTDEEITARSDAGLWRGIVADRRSTFKAYQSKFSRALMQARADVLKKLESYNPQKAIEQRASALTFMFNLDALKTSLTAGFKPVSLSALNTAGQQVMDELKMENPWTTPDSNVLAFSRARENKISGAAENVFESIRSEITEGIDSGDSRDQIAARVKAAFNGIDDKRARTIAQTETAAAHGYGRHVAIKSTRIQRKKWVTSQNQNVRAAHRYMNGYVTGIDTPFPVTNPKTGETDHIQHPGDPMGAAWNVINCHCVEIATEDPLTENDDQAEQPTPE